MRMTHIAAAIMALSFVGASAGAAEARDGCGPGFHRGFYGYCRPNFGYRPFAYRPGFYGYRRFGWHRPHWHHGVAWHHRRGRGYRHAGWHGRWHCHW